LNITLYSLSVWVLPLVNRHHLSRGRPMPFVAHRLGDKTAWELGRVSFQPRSGISIPSGHWCWPAMLLLSHSPFLFGYAKPVPVNFRALNNPPARHGLRRAGRGPPPTSSWRWWRRWPYTAPALRTCECGAMDLRQT